MSARSQTPGAPLRTLWTFNIELRGSASHRHCWRQVLQDARRVGAALSENVYVYELGRFALVVPQVNCWHRLRAAGHDHCPRGHAGHPQRPDHRG
eukprot:scaffold94135_cov56-Phaeocystis_antarctica.AAC.1